MLSKPVPLAPSVQSAALTHNKAVPPPAAGTHFECVIECDTCLCILGRLYNRPVGNGVNVNITIPPVVEHTNCPVCHLGNSRRNYDRT